MSFVSPHTETIKTEASSGGDGVPSDAADAHALEVLEESLQRGRATCAAFNRRGTLLAAGTAAGVVEIWDFETRAVARELFDASAARRRERSEPSGSDPPSGGLDSGFEPTPVGAAVLSVHWSVDGARIIASCADGSVTVWDVRESDVVFRATFDAPLHDVRFSPTNASLALAAPSDDGPMTFALGRGRRRAPLPTMPGHVDVPSLVCRIPSAGVVRENASPGHAVFSASGAHAFVAGARGVVTVVETATGDIVQACKVPDTALIKRLELSVCGKHLLVLGNGRTVASYDVDERGGAARLRDGAASLGDAGETRKPPSSVNAFALVENEHTDDERDDDAQDDVAKNQKDGVLIPARVFAHAASRGQWSAAAFSHDARFVAAASSGGAHELHVWRRETGVVRCVAVGAEASKGVAQIVPHPTRALFVCLGSNGVMYVWSRAFAEKWSAFEPGFVELDDNEAYVEREDEFDVAEARRDPNDPSGSIAKALASKELVARGAAVEAAARVTEAEIAVRRELEAMEGAEAEAAEKERSASDAANGAPATGGVGAPETSARPVEASASIDRPPLDAATETKLVALIDASAPVARAPVADAGDVAPLAQTVRAIDQSAALELAAMLRGARSEAAAAAAAAAEAASLANSSALIRDAEQARAKAEAREAAERAAALGMTASELDPELSDVDVWTSPHFFADPPVDEQNAAREMHHLPMDLAPDPEATLVVETRVRRWRERERRQLEAGGAGTQPRQDLGAGEGAEEAAADARADARDGERPGEAGEKRKRALDDSPDDAEDVLTAAEELEVRPDA